MTDFFDVLFMTTTDRQYGNGPRHTLPPAVWEEFAWIFCRLLCEAYIQIAYKNRRVKVASARKAAPRSGVSDLDLDLHLISILEFLDPNPDL